MKLSVRTTQLVLVLGTLILISGLVLASRLPADVHSHAEASPDNLKLQQAIAVIQNGENPMEGIAMMREILAKDSTNIDVHWYLAQFSLTSQQIENAAFRFGKVIEYDTAKPPKYPEAYFWLAQTKLELDQREEAIPLLEKYLSIETDTVVIRGVEQMLEKVKGSIH